MVFSRARSKILIFLSFSFFCYSALPDIAQTQDIPKDLLKDPVFSYQQDLGTKKYFCAGNFEGGTLGGNKYKMTIEFWYKEPISAPWRRFVTKFVQDDTQIRKQFGEIAMSEWSVVENSDSDYLKLISVYDRSQSTIKEVPVYGSGKITVKNSYSEIDSFLSFIRAECKPI